MEYLANGQLKTRILKYDAGRFNFRKLIAEHFGVTDLENLHGHSETSGTVVVRETDQSSAWHKRFYLIGPHFFEQYEFFVKSFIQPLFNEAIVYQKIPTFRVHFPDNLGVGEFHRDRDYAHNLKEINFWLPVTPTFESNTIWIESEEGKEDFTPQACSVGEVLMFNGCHLKHGNKINKTGQTRVSFDFRVIPHSQYSEAGAGRSINMKTEFKIGVYFKLMPK